MLGQNHAFWEYFYSFTFVSLHFFSSSCVQIFFVEFSISLISVTPLTTFPILYLPKAFPTHHHDEFENNILIATTKWSYTVNTNKFIFEDFLYIKNLCAAWERQNVSRVCFFSLLFRSFWYYFVFFLLVQGNFILLLWEMNKFEFEVFFVVFLDEYTVVRRLFWRIRSLLSTAVFRHQLCLTCLLLLYNNSSIHHHKIVRKIWSLNTWLIISSV